MPCYDLKITQHPTREPISTDEAQRQLGFYDPARDSYVLSLIRAARLTVETQISRALGETQYLLGLQHWPASGCIYVPRAQLISVESITYTDNQEATQTIDPAMYAVDTLNTPGRIVPAAEYSWPTVSEWAPQPIQIAFTSGYGSSVPESLRQGMYVLMRYYAESGELGAGSMPENTWDAFHNLVQQESWGHYV